jgi:hypothetical protein
MKFILLKSLVPSHKLREDEEKLQVPHFSTERFAEIFMSLDGIAVDHSISPLLHRGKFERHRSRL